LPIGFAAGATLLALITFEVLFKEKTPRKEVEVIIEAEEEPLLIE